MRKQVKPLAVIVTVIIGLAIGAALAAWQRGGSSRTVSHASEGTATVTKRVAAAPAAAATSRATARPIATAAPVVATPVPAIATPVPAAATPAPAPATASPVVTPMPATAVAAANGDRSALQGAWQIDEANVQVGRMVWSGDAAISSGGEMVLDEHKASVGGRAATRCERQSNLHAVVALGVAPQTVPFREVNCQGVTMSGEVRVSGFAPDGRSFHGSFWEGGVKLGDFTAAKL